MQHPTGVLIFPAMKHRLSERVDEQRPHLHLILPDPFEVAPVRTALALVLRSRACVRAHSLRRAGEGLPPELRIARYGLGVRRESDRAVERLIEGAVRGSHVDVRPLPADDDGRAATAAKLAASPPDTLLVVGWTRQGDLPDPERLAPLLAAYPGPIGLLIDDRGPPLTEVLGLGPTPSSNLPITTSADEILRAIERAHPTFRVATRDDSQAAAALADATERTLVVMPVVPATPGWLGDAEGLEQRLPGRLLLLFAPAEGRTERLLALLEAISAGRAARAAS